MLINFLAQQRFIILSKFNWRRRAVVEVATLGQGIFPFPVFFFGLFDLLFFLTIFFLLIGLFPFIDTAGSLQLRKALRQTYF